MLSLKFGGEQLKVKLSICTNPWKIKLDFELPKLPWYVSVKFGPIIIPIDHRRHEGITKIHSVSRAGAKISWSRFCIQNRVNNHSGNLGANTLDRIPQASCPRGQAMHRRIVSPAPTKLCLWQALSSKLWTGETDVKIGHLNLTLYTLNFASPDPSL